LPLADLLYQLTPSPALLLLVIAIIALVESLALVGVLVPGVVMLTAAASMAGHQEIALPTVLLVAFTGAVIGDGVSFLLGYTQRERVMGLWPLSRHPEWLAQGSRFFRRYGSLSVFFARFVGPVRPIVPMIAGMLHMSPGAFLWANLASAVLWAPAYVLPGYLLGRTWQKLLDLPPGAEAILIGLGVALVILAVVFSWLRQQVARSGRLYRLVAAGARRHPVMRRLWLGQVRGRDEVPLASWLLLILALGALSGWTLMVILQDGPTALDLRIHALFAFLWPPGLEPIGQLLARVGDSFGILALVLPWGLWLLWKGHRSAFWHLTVGLAGIALLNTLGKALIGRERPEAPLHLADSFAYPSAHVSATVVVLGLAAAFIAQEVPRHRAHGVYWVAILMAVSMATSRLIIGVHWFSDLVGGALLGLVVCALVRLSWQSSQREPLSPCPAAWLAGASLILVAARIVWLPVM
jgi:undecaprenyl-diphosphatase